MQAQAAEFSGYAEKFCCFFITAGQIDAPLMDGRAPFRRGDDGASPSNRTAPIP